MLLNEDPCEGCKYEKISNDGALFACSVCPKRYSVTAYHAQRELLGKVVEWLENLGDEPRWVTYKHKAKVIANELKKELSDG